MVNRNVAITMLRNYPQIAKWLGFWLEQLMKMGDPDDYRVIIGELEEIEAGIAQEEHDENLRRLDYHLCIASTVTKNLEAVFSEKSKLGEDVDEANRTILDKLAEIRAIVGLHRLGFEDIKFTRTPDFVAGFSGNIFLIEVTRLGASAGKRSDVWDRELGSIEQGVKLSMILEGQKSTEAILDAIYREVEHKCAQLRKSNRQADRWMVWISLGRDYLTAGLYELPDVGLLVRMSIPKKAVDAAVQQFINTELYPNLSHVVLSLGRDNTDLVSPELK